MLAFLLLVFEGRRRPFILEQPVTKRQTPSPSATCVSGHPRAGRLSPILSSGFGRRIGLNNGETTRTKIGDLPNAVIRRRAYGRLQIMSGPISGAGPVSAGDTGRVRRGRRPCLMQVAYNTSYDDKTRQSRITWTSQGFASYTPMGRVFCCRCV